MSTHHNDEFSYAVIGAAMAVHKELGHGFLEAVYQEGLSVELAARSIPFASEVPLHINYRNKILRTHYKADFVCFENMLVEIKALKTLSGTEEAQILNYLKASKCRRPSSSTSADEAWRSEDS